MMRTSFFLLSVICGLTSLWAEPSNLPPARALLHDLIASKEDTSVGEERAALIASNQNTAQRMQSVFFKTHDMLFFFSSTCPHCHNQAPVLKQWASGVGAMVLAYSFDGQSLPDFQAATLVPPSLVDVAFQGQAIRYPALFVMNREDGMLYPVAIGELSLSELSVRLSILLPKIIAFERGHPS